MGLHSSVDTEGYAQSGYVIARGLLTDLDFKPLESRCLEIVNRYGGRTFTSLRDPELIDFLGSDREAEQFLYAEIRLYPELAALSLNPLISARVKQCLGRQSIVLMGKIPFRIDCPMTLRELAVWHQDYFYVGGSENAVTVWIPLFDVSYREGCLLVMPGSHRLGVLEHDMTVLGKRHYPSGIFDHPVQYVEMQRGDVLFFDACLLHSSGNNISDTIRFSIQARFQEADRETHPAMGKRIPVNEIP